MKESERHIKQWLDSAPKEHIFIRKMVLILLTFYLLYRIGYFIGVFLSNIGL